MLFDRNTLLMATLLNANKSSGGGTASDGNAMVTMIPIYRNGVNMPNTYIEGIDTLFVDAENMPDWFGISSGFMFHGARRAIVRFCSTLNTFSNMFNGYNLQSSYGFGSRLEEIELYGSTENVTTFYMAFTECKALKRITGELDLSSATNVTNMFYLCEALEEVRFTPNSIKISLEFYPSTSLSVENKLSNASLISMANGLNSSVSGKTLKLHNSSYSYIPLIIGRNDNGTFVEDTGGTLTLDRFITDVKHWTLARY